jgi:hypothetical protein
MTFDSDHLDRPTPLIPLGFQSRASAYLAVAFAPGIVGAYKLPLSVEFYDGLGEYDNAILYRFTAIAEGYYLILGTAVINFVPINQVEALIILLNGAVALSADGICPDSAGDSALRSYVIRHLVAGDFIELWISINNIAESVNQLPEATRLDIHRLS